MPQRDSRNPAVCADHLQRAPHAEQFSRQPPNYSSPDALTVLRQVEWSRWTGGAHHH